MFSIHKDAGDQHTFSNYRQTRPQIILLLSYRNSKGPKLYHLYSKFIMACIWVTIDTILICFGKEWERNIPTHVFCYLTIQQCLWPQEYKAKYKCNGAMSLIISRKILNRKCNSYCQKQICTKSTQLEKFHMEPIKIYISSKIKLIQI